MHKKLGVWILVGVFGVINLATASAPDTLWTRTFGGNKSDYGYSVQQTFDSGFIITGYTNSFGVGTPSYSNVYLIKTNASGDTLWTKTFGGTNSDGGLSVQQTSDSGFIITGFTYSFGTGTPNCSNVYLIKTNSSGNTLWTKTFGGSNTDEGHSVQQTEDNGFIIAGLTNSFIYYNYYDVYLIKTNFSGDTIWTKTFGDTGGDYGSSVQQTQDGGFIIAGMTFSFGAGIPDFQNVYLIKTNSSGDPLWTKIFGGTNFDEGNSVQQTQDGGFIVAGETGSFGAGNRDVYLIKTNSSGDSLWARTFGGTNYEGGYSVQQTQDSGFIVAGTTCPFGDGGDIYIVRTNSSGDTLWTKTFGGMGTDWGYSVQQTQDGGFIIAGTTKSFGAGNEDVYLIRLGKETAVEENRPVWTDYNLSILQNPITNFVTISYTLPSQSNITLNLYDITGKLVEKIVNKFQSTGPYTLNWSSKKIPAGVYFIKFSTENSKETKKFVLVK
ncbi:MAG: T9SS type A sorting domain-containing protein [bacterium]|nr:T9SS type A sorting domain-containing protein [bacterium]